MLGFLIAGIILSVLAVLLFTAGNFVFSLVMSGGAKYLNIAGVIILILGIVFIVIGRLAG